MMYDWFLSLRLGMWEDLTCPLSMGLIESNIEAIASHMSDRVACHMRLITGYSDVKT